MNTGNDPRTQLPARRRLALRLGGFLFFMIGMLALGYCGYVLLETRFFQAYQSGRFEAALERAKSPASQSEIASRTVPAAPADEFLEPASGGGFSAEVLLGRMEIKRIGLTAMVMEGVESRTLRRAAGHIPGSALPGVAGNIGIAGHRDTFFSGLRHVRQGDEVTLTTLSGVYRYRVEDTLVVEASDTWVLAQTAEEEALTLVTCYPFTYVGPAPQRFIVRARRLLVQDHGQ